MNKKHKSIIDKPPHSFVAAQMHDGMVDFRRRYFSIQLCTKCPYYWLSQLTYARNEALEILNYRPCAVDEGCIESPVIEE